MNVISREVLLVCFVLLLDATVINVRCKTTYPSTAISILHDEIRGNTSISSRLKKKLKKKKINIKNDVSRNIYFLLIRNFYTRVYIYRARKMMNPIDSHGLLSTRESLWFHMRFLFRVTFLSSFLSREQARRCEPATWHTRVRDSERSGLRRSLTHGRVAKTYATLARGCSTSSRRRETSRGEQDSFIIFRATQ